jgi:hypothetical protein
VCFAELKGEGPVTPADLINAGLSQEADRCKSFPNRF